MSDTFGQGQHVDVNNFAAGMAILVTAYFWHENLKGVHESSGKALRIMQITTVMVVVIMIWAPITIAVRGLWGELPPFPVASNLQFAEESQAGCTAPVGCKSP
ncbi:MAG: hypothetical protein WDO18_09490 [Acidobacteriota bacterium]